MIVKLENIAKSYPKSNFKLEKISFEINSGDIIGIVGQNGTGKSTLLKIIASLVKIDNGKIFYQNKDITQLNEKEMKDMRKNIAYIFQEANLLENKTVFYHLSLIYKLNKVPIKHTEIDDMLNFMGLYSHKHSKCRNLSGGQKQKVAIAMALLQKPKVLLCDEISSALDKNSEEEIFKLLLKIKNLQGVAMLVISHNLSLIKNLCDKVLILQNGTINHTIIPTKSNLISEEKEYYEYVKGYLKND